MELGFDDRKENNLETCNTVASVVTRVTDKMIDVTTRTVACTVSNLAHDGIEFCELRIDFSVLYVRRPRPKLSIDLEGNSN